MGDVMDRRKYISYKIANDFRVKFIQRFQKSKINLHMLVGNHDTYYKNTSDVNSLEELIKFSKIKVYKDPTIVKFDDLPIVFMPWINTDNYVKAIKMLNTA
ncbi:uncharacterized protein METZ01_LOCUS428405, partial [marine metagenome]